MVLPSKLDCSHQYFDYDWNAHYEIPISSLNN